MAQDGDALAPEGVPWFAYVPVPEGEEDLLARICENEWEVSVIARLFARRQAARAELGRLRQREALRERRVLLRWGRLAARLLQ